jgi:hypothetical protein
MLNARMIPSERRYVPVSIANNFPMAMMLETSSLIKIPRLLNENVCNVYKHLCRKSIY